MAKIEDILHRKIRESRIVICVAILMIGFMVGLLVGTISYQQQFSDLKTAARECCDKETFEKIRVRYLELQHVQTDRLFEETK